MVSKLKSPARHNEWHRLVILIPRKLNQEDHEAGQGYTVSHYFTEQDELRLSGTFYSSIQTSYLVFSMRDPIKIVC